MKNNNINVNLWFLIGAVLVIAVVASVATSSITGNAIFQSNLKANSCDADSICEVQGTISSGNALKLSSRTGVTKLESDLTLTKIGQSGGAVFKTNNEGSLTITPQSGYTKLESDLTLTKVGYTGGVVFKSNENGSLTITPYSGLAKLEGDLTLIKTGSPSGVVLETILDQLVVKASLTRFQGVIASNNMTGNGSAYACVNEKGILYRSLTACR
ncbi:hypothetical protein J4218_02680 [Candidatus Pacearchaeota archaeon]|nr:hypothetical protein [Candidatus Pacearchaeota archaeon]